MDKRATVRPVRASYSIEQVENGWTVSTNDGTVFVFADSKELVVWFCMVVGGTVRTETFRTGRRGITDTETGKGLRLVRENDIRFLQSRSQRATGETSNVSPQWTIATFSMQDKKESSIETKTVHAGEPSPRINGAVVMPIFQSATFESTGERTYDDIRYIRLNNTPNHKALAEKLAQLENAEAALVTSSGMAAITTTLLALLSTGDHLLVQDCLYGGTHDFVTKDLRDFGISYDFINGNKPEDWKRKLKTNTKAIYVETIANPLMGVPHLEDVVEFASAKGIVSVIDNTFASPINFRPPELGFDLSLHSATKYLNGHSDIVAGAVIGSRDLVKKITHRLNHLGGSLDPHAAFLLHRGMKTLALRVKHQNGSALRIAQFLQKHPSVAKVNYPGLESHPQYGIAQRLFDGYGGMMSFELHGGIEAAESFMQKAKLPIVAPSLGGVESLVTRPSITSHSGMSPADRKKLGITDGLIRFSVGIEGTDDLIEDFKLALGQLRVRV